MLTQTGICTADNPRVGINVCGLQESEISDIHPLLLVLLTARFDLLHGLKVALAMTLLCSASLLTLSLIRLQRVGFGPPPGVTRTPFTPFAVLLH